MKPFSVELRKQVLADAKAGLNSKELAYKYNVSRAWVDRVKQRYRESGEIGPRTRRPRLYKNAVLAAHMGRLQDLVEEKPDRTLRELRELLGIKVSLAALCRALQRLGYKSSRRRILNTEDRILNTENRVLDT